MLTIAQLQERAYATAKSKGWHNDRLREGDVIHHARVLEKDALMHTELTEVRQAFREGKRAMACEVAALHFRLRRLRAEKYELRRRLQGRRDRLQLARSLRQPREFLHLPRIGYCPSRIERRNLRASRFAAAFLPTIGTPIGALYQRKGGQVLAELLADVETDPDDLERLRHMSLEGLGHVSDPRSTGLTLEGPSRTSDIRSG